MGAGQREKAEHRDERRRGPTRSSIQAIAASKPAKHETLLETRDHAADYRMRDRSERHPRTSPLAA